MADATRSIYVVLGGLAMGNAAIETFDWADLMASPMKRGENTVAPGLAGAEPGPRAANELRAGVQVRLNGEWDYETGAPVLGTEARLENYFYLLSLLRSRTEDTGVQDVTLATPWQWYTGRCQVESGGTPSHLNPWASEFVLDLTLPDGVPLPSEEYTVDDFYGGGYE